MTPRRAATYAAFVALGSAVSWRVRELLRAL